MRNFVIPLLLASAAIPATASAEPGDQDQSRLQREDRGDRGDRGDRDRGAQRSRDDSSARQASPPQQQQQQQRPQQEPQPQQQQAPRQMRMERPDRGFDQQQEQQQNDRQSRPIERQQRIEQQRQLTVEQSSPFVRPGREQRDWNGNAAHQPGAQEDVVREPRNRGPRVITTDGLPQENRGFGQRGLPDRGDVDRAGRPLRGSLADRIDRNQERDLARRTRRPGLPPGTVTGVFPHPGGITSGGLQSTPLPGGGELRHSGSGSQWATHWRDDRRYDWQDWRRHHHSSFHIGFYSDPFGCGYQRLNYGWTLFPSYYQSNYWLRDPWQYRLPPAYGPYRWVRYWDDALLVDTYSGEVVDVIYDFFW